MPRPPMPSHDHAVDMSDSHSSRVNVIELVGWKRRVLELGCATGQVSQVLRERGCEVVGIEVDPEAAKLAAEACDAVIVGDIEQLDLGVELGDRQFDVILAAGVLEHLRDPAEVLTGLRRFLAPDGYMVVCAPNVAHGSVRLALLQGSFPYSDVDRYDGQQLHFFTRSSLVDMLEQSGFDVAHIDDVVVPLSASGVPFDAGAVPAELLAELEQDPDARVAQFVAVAFVAVTPPAAIPRLLQRLSRRLAGLERSHGEAEQLRDLAGQAEQLALANEELQLRLFDARDALVRSQHEHENVRVHRDAIAEESGRRAQVILDIEDHVADLSAEVEFQRSVANGARARLAAVEEDARAARAAVRAAEEDARTSRAALEAAEDDVRAVRAALEAAEADARTSRGALGDAEARNALHARQLEESERLLHEIHSSRLWRVATPYRRFVEVLRVARGR
ncbi:MAG: glycosyl transferase, family 2 [Acidimicrobiales bacterium]|jgi:2-polyprenyl-3-methyl-5-hydroxy-6-metoxy-1,4-benzoquinol methylase|nr:glycosyl transferase, family 2 [Acidimicrobiales bacterium]